MARILVVDDVKFITQMLKSVFEEKGHRVTTASNGVEAIAKAREEQPELVLLDIAMPEMDGIEVTRKLKADAATRSIPIIVVSAKNDKPTIAAAYAAGAAEFTLKPFNNEDLLRKVGELLGGHRMNFTIDVVKGLPVITVLLAELDEVALEQFKQSLETARGGGGRPMILDFTRVRKVPPGIIDVVFGVQKELEDLGGKLAVVAPARAVGLKSFLAQIDARVKPYETIDAAVEALRRSLGESSGRIAMPPAAPIKTESGTARIKDAKRGLVLESRENLTLVWLRRKALGEDLFDALGEMLPKSSNDVYVDFREVEEFSSKDVGGIGKLVKKLKGDGRNLLLVNPIPKLAEALKSAGLGGLIAQMDAADSAGGTHAPTTASS
jgi:CheY-like chemotaxis protein